MTELKPCPFCGGKAKIYKYAGSDIRTRYIMCTCCGMGTDRMREEEAIEKWNRRVKE